MNKHTKYIGIYSCLFCGIVIVVFGTFLENGKVIIWDTDAIGQYYPVFLYIGQWLRGMLSNILHGNFNLRLFDMQIGMGEDVIGCLNYYGFGDPLNILAILANKATGPYVFTAMFFLKIYLSGIAFYYYSIKINANKVLICIGALAYAFSGFAIAGGGRYIGFLSPMIYFPLMLAGCEDIFRKKKSNILMLSVAYASICNFYFLYMTSLFLAIYCSVRLLFIYSLKDIKIITKTIVQCLYRYILGVLLAAPVLIPSIMAFLNSNRTELDIREILLNVHNWIPDIELLKCFLTGYRFNSETVYWSGVPVVELLLIFMSAFFIKTKRDRQCILAVFLGILAWMMPITSYIASAFGNYYTRWVFMLQFLLCIVMICTLQNILAKIKNVTVRIEHIILSIVGIAVVLNISLINYEMISSEGGGWIQVFVTAQEARKYVDSPKNVSAVINEDEGLYRISNDQLYDINQRPDNSAMLNDYYGLNFWFSIVNGNTQRMINQLCTYDVNNWRSYGMNNSAIYETLAGVRYHISKDDDAPQGYALTENIDFDGESWKVFKNNNYLPLAYTYSDTISIEEYEKLNGIQKMGCVLEYIVMDEDNSPNNGADASDMSESNELLDRIDGRLVTVTDDSIIFEFDILENADAYLYIPQYRLPDCVSDVTIIKDEEVSYRYSNDKERIFGIGGVNRGENVKVKISGSMLGAEDIFEYIQLWTISDSKLKTAVNELRENSADDLQIKDNRINGHISVDEEKYMLLAVPYSIHWDAYVDGEKVPIFKANTMYMGIKLDKGDHYIEFVYGQRGVIVGIRLLVLALFSMGIKKMVLIWKVK